MRQLIRQGRLSRCDKERVSWTARSDDKCQLLPEFDFRR